MASLPPSVCCTQGFKHEGTPCGALTELNGIETYVVGKESTNIILFLTDIWGHKSVNSQLLADQFAQSGFLVIMPDLFFGDPLPPNPYKDGPELINAWRPKHTAEITRPIVDKVMSAIEALYQPQYIAAVGYCFGAKFAVQLLDDNKIQAASICHPSAITLDEIKAIKGPLMICAAETDKVLTPESRKATEEALKEIKARYFITLASGTTHGFASHGDIKDPVVKFAKERAFFDTVNWFNEFLPNDDSKL